MKENTEFTITMLGEFSISYRGNTISDNDNRSKKPWNLLEYLITNRTREISQSELIDKLWESKDSSNPAGALKVLLHRVRKSLEELEYSGAEGLIIQSRGMYSWNNNVLINIDADTFTQLITEASDESLPADTRISLYKDAFALYKGDFLARNSREIWVIPISVKLHSLFVNGIHTCCDLLFEAKRYTEIEQLCRQAIKIEALDEKLYYRFIHALTLSGKQQEAINEYNNVTDMFFNKFGISPSAELKSLYREIVKTKNTLELDLYTIMEDLKEQRSSSKGAFFCEYEFFKDIFQLESRTCARSGDSIYICLMTLNLPQSGNPKQKFQNKVMDDLQNCIHDTLRRGDVYSRYSVTQFIILLPTTSFENGQMVLERILSLFHKKYTRKNMAVQYKLLPLEPVM